MLLLNVFFQVFSALSYLSNPLLLSTLIILLIYKYVSRKSNYWSKRNVVGPTPYPFIGNLWGTMTLKISLGELFKNFHDSSDKSFVGIFTYDEPALVIRDPQIVKDILHKDFRYFTDRIIFPASHDQIFSNLLFVQTSPNWKLTRTKLSPVFSSAKLKGAFDIMKNVCDQMINYTKLNTEQDCKQLFQKFATEVVSQVFLGIEGHCFNGKVSEIYKKVRTLFDFTMRNAAVQSIFYFKSSLVNPLKLSFFKNSTLNFFRDLFWACLENKEQIGKSNSLISFMKDLRIADPTFGKFNNVT